MKSTHKLWCDIGGGALGFHSLRVWLILARGFLILCLNLPGFRILRCATGCGFVLCLCFGYFNRISYFSGFPVHTVHVVHLDRKAGFRMLKSMHRDSVKRKPMKKLKDLKTKIEDLCSVLQFPVLALFILGFCVFPNFSPG